MTPELTIISLVTWAICGIPCLLYLTPYATFPMFMRIYLNTGIMHFYKAAFHYYQHWIFIFCEVVPCPLHNILELTVSYERTQSPSDMPCSCFPVLRSSWSFPSAWTLSPSRLLKLLVCTKFSLHLNTFRLATIGVRHIEPQFPSCLKPGLQNWVLHCFHRKWSTHSVIFCMENIATTFYEVQMMSTQSQCRWQIKASSDLLFLSQLSTSPHNSQSVWNVWWRANMPMSHPLKKFTGLALLFL